jgi:hypothetical protein
LAPIGATPVPFRAPVVPGAAVTCRPSPGGAFGVGWSTVTCEAVAPEGSTVESFPLVVKPVPEMAATGSATAGGAWRAVGVGFAPASSISLEIEGRVVVDVTAGPDGRVSATFVIPPDVTAGAHTLVLRGVDGNGDPNLVVGQLDLLALEPDATPPTEPPPDAPHLPPDQPVPPDPGPPPTVPAPSDPVSSDPESSDPSPETATAADPAPAASPTDEASTTAEPVPTTGSLPVTGGQFGGIVLLGLALVGGGVALLRVRRLRRD